MKWLGLIEYEYISRCLRFISTLSVHKAVQQSIVELYILSSEYGKYLTKIVKLNIKIICIVVMSV